MERGFLAYYSKWSLTATSVGMTGIYLTISVGMFEAPLHCITGTLTRATVTSVVQGRRGERNLRWHLIFFPIQHLIAPFNSVGYLHF